MPHHDDDKPNSPGDVGGSSDAGGWTGGKTSAADRVTAKCRGCRKPIRWVRMDSGEMMPCEPKPVHAVQETADFGQPSLFEGNPTPKVRGRMVKVWIPHWANCPAAKRHRRRG